MGHAIDNIGNGLWLTGFSKDNPIGLFELGKRPGEMLLFLCYLQEGCLGIDHYLKENNLITGDPECVMFRTGYKIFFDLPTTNLFTSLSPFNRYLEVSLFSSLLVLSPHHLDLSPIPSGSWRITRHQHDGLHHDEVAIVLTKI